MISNNSSCHSNLYAELSNRHAYHITEVLVFGVAVVGKDVHDDVQHHHVARHHIVFVNLAWLEVATYRHLNLHNPPTLNLAEQGVHLRELLHDLRPAVGNGLEHPMGKGVAQTLGIGEDLDIVVVDGSTAFEPKQRGDDVLATAIDAGNGLGVVEGEDMLVVLTLGLVVPVDDSEKVLRLADDSALQQLIDRDVEGYHLDAVLQHIAVEQVFPLFVYFHR